MRVLHISQGRRLQVHSLEANLGTVVCVVKRKATERLSLHPSYTITEGMLTNLNLNTLTKKIKLNFSFVDFL